MFAAILVDKVFLKSHLANLALKGAPDKRIDAMRLFAASFACKPLFEAADSNETH